MPHRGAANSSFDMPTTRPRSGIFHLESTRLRSNVADQVQRDLLPAGRMLSVFLVSCELLAEIFVLFWSRGHPCDRPLRFWLLVLIMLQVATVVLSCINIFQGRDSFAPHRNGLSASDLDMYANSTPTQTPVTDPSQRSVLSVVVEVVDPQPGAIASPTQTGAEPLIESASQDQSSQQSDDNPPATFPQSSSLPSRLYISTDFLDRYVRIINACYLFWFILGSIWVSNGGTCSETAPHLYRLIVALTIIYYALLFLPLACFCLIVCCLPLFILVYRIMLPYAERERRRARAADPAQVQSLSAVPYSAATFSTHTGNDSLEDASCVICLCDYEVDEMIRFLPCKHHFHKDCVDVWLRLDKACCLCKQDIDSQSLQSV